MKACLILAVVGLTFAVIGLIASQASAHVHGRWEGNRGSERGFDRSDRRGWRGDREGADGEDRGGRHWGRKDRHHGRDRHSWKYCECGNQCAGNSGTKNIGCFKTRSDFLQCVDTTCTKKTCQEGQMFNFTSKACEACPAGYHVDAEKRKCVCDRGTTFDFKTRRCVPCASGAIVTDDKCYCDKSVLDRSQNTCRQCPEGTTKRGWHCMCNDRTKFWSHSAFECQNCPGVWVDAPERTSNRRGGRYQSTGQVCQCEGENQIFNKWTVSCITCPTNSLVATKKGSAYCDCLQVGERYDWKENKCVSKTSIDDDDDDDDDTPDEPQPL